MPNLPNLFSTFLKIRGYSAVTIRNYRSDLNHFLGWLILSLKSRNLPVFNNYLELLKYYFRENFLTDYKKYLVDNNLPFSTINRRLSTLRTLADFCLEQGLIKENPAKAISNLTAPQSTKTNISLGQEQILLDFQKALEKEGNTSNTIKNYLSDIREFLAWAKTFET